MTPITRSVAAQLFARCAATVILAGAAASAQAQSGSVYSRPLKLPSAGAGAAASSGSSGPRAKFEPAGDRVYHGASLPNTWEDSGLRSQVQRYQKIAGKRLSVVTWFASAYEKGRLSSWRNDYAGPLARVKRAGAMSLIKFSTQDYDFNRTRKIASTKHIAQGVYDAYFEEAAEAVRDFRDPVFISINHEMNGTWYPFSEAYAGSGVTAQDYVASWRRIVDIFRRKGAGNAAWVWAPNVPDVGPVSHAKYYPGDDYVDWVGVSLYSGNPMSNLAPIYRIYAPRKPLFVTEWATGDDKSKYYQGYPGNAAWVRDFFSALGKNYPRVKAISWFQWDKRQYGESDYLLERDPQQAQAYAQDIQSPRYIDNVEGLTIPPPGGYEETRVQVTPAEVVLREPVAAERPRAQAARLEAPRASRPRLQIVPRERVLQER